MTRFFEIFVRFKLWCTCINNLFYRIIPFQSLSNLNQHLATPYPKIIIPLPVSFAVHQIHTHYFPSVKNNRSPTSPNPGFIMPLSLISSSMPASQISVPSGHSFAAFKAPTRAPSTDITIIRPTPHSLRVWIAATQVPPVAMTGSTISEHNH